MTLNEEGDPSFYADLGATTHTISNPDKISKVVPYEENDNFFLLCVRVCVLGVENPKGFPILMMLNLKLDMETKILRKT